MMRCSNKSAAILAPLVVLLALVACESSSVPLRAELLIRNGQVYRGEPGKEPSRNDVAIAGGKIVFVGDATLTPVAATREIDVDGLLVTAGFIDPHTHSLGELLSESRNANLNYLYQGVTTVLNGNDGGGDPKIAALTKRLLANGMGTNTALYVGHGAVRRAVLGGDNRAPTDTELETMQALVRDAMGEGALGLSSGLFYAPGSYAKTEEVVALARIAAAAGGLYDTHIRDESSYTIGLDAAIEEALEVGVRADIPVHISHIKALGVDVWGQSGAVIERIEAARAAGQRVTADQYPWRASGTHLHNALLPKAFLEGERGSYVEKLADPTVRESLRNAVTENLRRRGGAESILLVNSPDTSLDRRTLAAVAEERGVDDVTAALELLQQGSHRIASFNMNNDDIRAFMRRDWVMTSSDGTDGHPRKYASFPKKYRSHVADAADLSLVDFLYRSSALTATTLGLADRGRIEPGLAADIIVLDLNAYAPAADFSTWNVAAKGVVFAMVNGKLVIDQGAYTGALPGQVLSGPGINSEALR